MNHGMPFQRQPAGSVHLAYRRPPALLEIANLLGPIGGNDANQFTVGIEGERNGDDMGRSVGAQRAERGQLSFAEEVDFGWGEFGCPACHDGQTIGVRQAM